MGRHIARCVSCKTSPDDGNRTLASHVLWFTIQGSGFHPCVRDLREGYTLFLPRHINLKRKKEKIVFRKSPTIVHFAPIRHQDFLISRWKRLYLGNDKGKLPLNRLAYLKARYRIGPFMRYRYANELSITFFREIAERPVKTNWNDNVIQDECHPRKFVTEFTDKYLQYRALLYYAQETENVDADYQITIPEDNIIRESSLDEPVVLADTYKASTIASRIIDERFLVASDIAPGFEETEDAIRKRQEFEDYLEASKKKLEDVQGVFHIIKQGRQLKHTVRDERQKYESETDEAVCNNLRKFFPFSRCKKKE
ncbi:hypothetical protein HNY73_016395 [Argiope bruennichi]|uniref:Uncharacterized protein n=1 Tax=Argiope bruennichi TaxID=94029 RepID=A0A8T0EK00_ARGBR|nr:hypothetical protein HNY73_016395 [Argiope bruennichi]